MLRDDLRRVRNLLVVQTGRPAAVLRAGPALRSLRVALPRANVTFLSSAAGSRAASLLRGVQVMTGQAVWQVDAGGAQDRALIEDLRARHLEAAVILPDGARSPHPAAYTCYLAGIPIRLGQSKEFGGGVLAPQIKAPAESGRDEALGLYMLSAAGLETCGHYLEVDVPPLARAEARRRLSAAGVDPRALPVVVAAGEAGLLSRRGDVAELTRLLATHTGVPTVSAGAGSLLGLLDWPELAAVMSHACLVVTDDAGYLALADALPRPMVGVGPLSEPGDAWQPAGAAARLIDNVHEGAGCHLEPIVEAAVGVLEATAGTFTPYDALASHRHLG